jgi:hypothetical protein
VSLPWQRCKRHVLADALEGLAVKKVILINWMRGADVACDRREINFEYFAII